MSVNRTEHKSLHGVTEQTTGHAAETKDVPAPAEQPRPTVRVDVVNFFRDEAGALYTPGETVTLDAQYARSLGPVYVKAAE
jgi:hypothetical protein